MSGPGAVSDDNSAPRVDVLSPGEPAGEQESDRGALSAGTFADPIDYEATLKRSLALPNNGNNNVMDAFDGAAGAPILVAQQCDYDNQVVSTETKDGKVVREHMECGPDYVVAYDDQGQAHRFPDQKITSLPVNFSSIPEWRLKQFNETAYKMIESRMVGLRPDGGPDGMISFNDCADMMKEISKMTDLTEVEKARLWSEVRNVMQERAVPILDADEQTDKIDSWKGSRDPWHALITMNDGYHGNTLINQSPEKASQAIRAHEEGAETKNMGWWGAFKWNAAKTIFGTNTGDINASEGQLAALRAYRSEGTFAAYAAEWERQFVRPDRDKYGWQK